MIIYLHMHKCAGTSVVRAAQASGLRLPAIHRNGNLQDQDDKPIKYRGVAREDFVALIRQQIDQPTDFMAMEWDFPRWEMFDGLAPLRFFTSLRDPLTRAISNFRMDKVAGWIDRDVAFGDYINGDALYCSDNYYVKILCQRWPKDTATRADLDYAMAVLARFEAVIVVEQGNMRDVLARFGITPPVRRFNPFDTDAAQATGLSEAQLAVTRTEIRDFIDRNALDYEIYRHFTRAIRLADRSCHKETAHG
jgi:hypothetical protein